MIWTLADLKLRAKMYGIPIWRELRQFFVDCVWPGGYTLIYSDECDILCHRCAVRVFLQEGQIWASTYDEGPIEHCAGCGKEILASYRHDPDDPDAYVHLDLIEALSA